MSADTTVTRTTERVPPRRRKIKHSLWQTTVWPLARLTAVCVVGAFILVAVTAKIVRPFNLLSRESRETQRCANQLEALKKENSDLERQIKYLQTSRGAAQAARKLGYVKPGEITLVLPPEGRESTR